MTTELGGDRTRTVLVDKVSVQGTSGGMSQQPAFSVLVSLLLNVQVLKRARD